MYAVLNKIKDKVLVIGSGFSSLSTACYLAHQGYKVSVFEKNNQLGGRARQYKHKGFKFDMGPTWYWMPDVFDRFFNDFHRKTSDFYELTRLAPSYRVYFDQQDWINIDDSIDKILKTFESIEYGSSIELKKFLKKAQNNYEIAIENLVYKPGLSPFELVTKETIFELKQFYYSIHDYVIKHFKSSRLHQILEFPALFLGAKPSDTPLFYSFMNHADFALGTWFPKGGMASVVGGIVNLAKELGVQFYSDAPVQNMEVNESNQVIGLKINGNLVHGDIVISGADYKHSESLLPSRLRAYDDKYWSKRTMAPSSLLFYVGFSKKIKEVLHHTLFFDQSFEEHAIEIYDRPSWPKNPLFYASFPSITDNSLAPESCEAAIFLIPLAPDLKDTNQEREKYFEMIMQRLEYLTNQELKSAVMFKRSYCVNDFKEDYNSYRGNAYGMANTLTQTAFLRPSIKSKKVKNLYFTGQLTVPGPGVPPAIISGKLVSDLVIKENKIRYEEVV